MMIKLIITVMALKRTLVVATMSITNLMFSSSSGANPVLQQVGGVVRGSRWLWHCGMGTFHHSHPSHSRCQNMSKLPTRWLWLCGMGVFHHFNYLSHPRHCSCQISMAIAILIATNKNLSAKVIVNTDEETQRCRRTTWLLWTAWKSTAGEETFYANQPDQIEHPSCFSFAVFLFVF